MKKDAKIILIVISVILAVTAVLLGIFLSGNSLFADILGNGSEEQIKVLELQYKFTKKPAVLKNLCNALNVAGNEDESFEYYEKVAHYFELYVEGGNGFNTSDFGIYLIALSKISETEKLKTEIESFLKKDLSGKDYKTLYFSLSGIKQSGSAEEKEYIKQIAKEILEGSHLKSYSQSEYEDLVNEYMLLAE